MGRDLIFARIVSGSVRCPVSGKDRPRLLLLKRPSRDQRYAAEEVYQDSLREAELEGLYNEEELFEYLLENELWDEEREHKLEGISKDIEELKLGLFRLLFKAKERGITRSALVRAKELQQKLFAERHAYDYLSCQGSAVMSRQRFLTASSLYWPGGDPVFAGDAFWEDQGGLLEEALSSLSANRLTDEAFRDLVRNEPWRSFWNCRKCEGTLFGVPPADYSDEQRAAACWAALYDNVYEHPECPSDDVINDDDMFDGWLIYQRRQREDRLAKKKGEEFLTNEKIRSAGEVFIVADTAEDARKIDALNDEYGAAIKKQRLAHIQEKGVVKEGNMPDTQRNLRMEATRKFAASMRNA